jgi:EAL domain-containing protein (putative c-di-GMP-specific phosphodiesterase class I)
LGVEKLQGYYINKPLPWAEVNETYIRRTNQIIATLA